MRIKLRVIGIIAILSFFGLTGAKCGGTKVDTTSNASEAQTQEVVSATETELLDTDQATAAAETTTSLTATTTPAAGTTTAQTTSRSGSSRQRNTTPTAAAATTTTTTTASARIPSELVGWWYHDYPEKFAFLIMSDGRYQGASGAHKKVVMTEGEEGAFQIVNGTIDYIDYTMEDTNRVTFFDRRYMSMSNFTRAPGSENKELKRLTVNGLSGKRGRIYVSFISDFAKEGFAFEVKADVSGSSVTSILWEAYDYDRSMPWTGSGSFYIRLEFDSYDSLYFYTEGKSLSQLGIRSPDDLHKLPKFNMNNTTTTINFNQFVSGMSLWQ